MNIKKYIFIIIFIVAAAIVAFFAYGVVKQRYFGVEQMTGKNKSVETQSQTTNQGNDSQVLDEQAQSGATNAENSSSDEQNNPPADGSHLFVTSSDCDKNCKKFQGAADDLKYCQEVCGIIPAQSKSSDADCENLSGLDKDYCWRDLAVSKTDISICDKIGDTKLKKVCRNRVTEDLLN
jgi:hypothetical protein